MTSLSNHPISRYDIPTTGISFSLLRGDGLASLARPTGEGRGEGSVSLTSDLRPLTSASPLRASAPQRENNLPENPTGDTRDRSPQPPNGVAHRISPARDSGAALGQSLDTPPAGALTTGAEDSGLDSLARPTGEGRGEGSDLRASAPLRENSPSSPPFTTHHSPLPTLDPARLSEARLREPVIQAYAALLQSGCSGDIATRQIQLDFGVSWSRTKLDRLAARYTAEGFDGLQSKTHQSGRRRVYTPSLEEIAAVRETYIRLDESVARGRGLGSSKIAAFRLVARSDDPRITPEFKATVLHRHSRSVPPTWERLLQAPASVLDRLRDPRSTAAHYITTPRGRAIVDRDGVERPLRCGDIFEADDGTLNFYAWIHWPFGGDKCSEKYGVKLGRWQLLAVVDVASLMCVAFDVVCRERGSYRAEDSAALIGRTMCEVGVPGLWRLERGSWESHAVRDALDLCHVPVFNAWHSKQKAAVENFFDRLWTPASLIPGHVGRDRARYKPTTDLALACQDGRRDPRDFFLPIDHATTRLIKAIEFTNTELVESATWGKWTPQDRWETQTGSASDSLSHPMGEGQGEGHLRESASSADTSSSSPLPTPHSPLPTLDPRFRIFFAREQRIWTVRGCTVGGSVAGPMISFPTWFQHENLWQFEGCQVKCYFDPYQSPCAATIVLEADWRTFRRGHIIAENVPALDLPPQAVLSDDKPDAQSLAIRKAVAKAVRTEMWAWSGSKGTRKTIARDGLGNSVQSAPRPTASSQLPAPSSIPHLRPSATSADTPTVPIPARRAPDSLARPTGEGRGEGLDGSARDYLSRQSELANRIRELADT